MTPVFKTLTLASVLACASYAQAAVSFDANLELDTTHKNKISAPNTNARAGGIDMGGRVEVNAGAKQANGGAYVTARASLLLQKSGGTATDDMWVQFGNSAADVKLGRFEAMDLFPLGKDTLIADDNGIYTGYRANNLRGRFGSGIFHGALGVNAGSALRFELGLVETKDAGAAKGIRPAVTFNAGALTVRGGFESVKVNGVSGTKTGMGLSAGFALSKDASVNVNYAKKKDDKSIGVNATFGPAGFGLIQSNGAGALKSTIMYAAYSLPLMGVQGATITPAISYAKVPAGMDDQLSLRVRINYAF
jgi:hypothetical protein